MSGEARFLRRMTDGSQAMRLLSEFRCRAAFFILWVFALYMALSPRPPRLPLDGLGDKFEHILAFAVLTVLARLGFRKATDLRILERMSFAGAMIEVLQAIPALHRDCDWRDWAADTLATAGILAAMRLIPWHVPIDRPRG